MMIWIGKVLGLEDDRMWSERGIGCGTEKGIKTGI